MKFVRTRAMLLGVLAIVLLVIAVFAFDTHSTTKTTDIVSLVHDVQSGAVKQISLDSNGHGATVMYADSSRPQERVELPTGTSVSQVLAQANIPFSNWPPMPVASATLSSRMSPFLRVAFPILLILGLAIFILKRGSLGIGKSSGRRGAFDPIRPGERAVTLADVAGIEEVKEEVADVIDFLRDPERYYQLGARIPRGVLLAGPPGTGKTLLARAVAGEARASFLSVSGSEFVELYVGVGASRVRELFKRARECSPSIIFIDEIDAIGRKRGRAEHSTEYDQTLNQILVEMDGFEQRSTVIVLAATNRVDILDSALLRPGRFDRKVQVDLPDRAGRSAILRVHARGKPIDSGADLDELAARTTGLSGADLSNLLNEAAILTARRGGTHIGQVELLESIDRALAGPARRSRRFTDHEREIVAYHEAGHALVAHYLPNADTVRKVSIVSRGQAGGYTMIMPDEDRGLWTRPQLKDRLAALLGGYAAEQMIFGDVTTGSSNDLERVSSITLSMVSRYGMGASFGLFSFGDGEGSNGLSQRTAFAAESEARELVEEARQLAIVVLQSHRHDLEELTRRLLDVETVEGDELVRMFGPRTAAAPVSRRAAVVALPAPARNNRAPQRARRPVRLVERVLVSPAAIVAAALPRKRRQVPD